MRRFSLSFCALVFALALPLAVLGQSANFDVAQHGHSVGTASFNFTATKEGYDSSSVVRVTMQGLDYALSKNETLSSANQLLHAQLSAVVNGSAVTVVAKPDAGQLLVNISANGRSTTTTLATHDGAIFLPDFDPGALETLLALAVERNNRDLWAITPKGSGTIAPIELATLADLTGTLDGKPVTVHHLTAAVNNAKTEMFSGPENQLLQAELPQEGFALVRKGFVLQPPAKAPAAPQAPAQTVPAPTPQNSPAQ